MSQAEQIRTEVFKSVKEEENEAFLTGIVRGIGSMHLLKQGVELLLESDRKGLLDEIKPILLKKGVKEFHYLAKEGHDSITISARESGALLQKLGLIGEGFVPKQGIDCEEIYNSTEKLGFLKGLFAGCGSVSLPDGEDKHGYHVEINVMDEALAQDLLQLLNGLELDKWHLIPRKYTTGVYLKDGEQTFEFLILMGATKTALELQSAIAVKELRNHLNRQNNIQSANLDKTVNASIDIIQDILFLEEAGILQTLSSKLNKTARLRRENPDLSLQELANLVGDTTKSGLSHRIKKLQRLADEARKNKGGQQ